jgi:uncharacterized HAD superfamily protein
VVIYVDIDGTICTPVENADYSKAEPIKENVKKANALYDEGHTIVYWTARGTTTGIDWREVTEAQLSSWGAKYHDLKLGKPFYDIFIDDKAINVDDWGDIGASIYRD